jgi:hypothetical protein
MHLTEHTEQIHPSWQPGSYDHVLNMRFKLVDSRQRDTEDEISVRTRHLAQDYIYIL